MTDARWTLRLLLAALMPITGCGGTRSAEKSYDHFVAAAEALEKGDEETALEELSATIDISPNDWAYFERGRILAEQRRDEEAADDVQKGLELAPNHPNLKWLEAELKKPPSERFQGRFAKPPGMRKAQT